MVTFGETIFHVQSGHYQNLIGYTNIKTLEKIPNDMITYKYIGNMS